MATTHTAEQHGEGLAPNAFDRAIEFDKNTHMHPAAWTGRIVVGVDGSPESLKALGRAVAMAIGSHTAVQAVVAWHNPSFSASMAMTGWTPEADAQQILDDAEATVYSGARPTWFTGMTRQGSPANVLIKESLGADMLVVGSRGHGGFAGLLLGSVSAVCAEHAHCPVLIMHDDEAR